jgi:hypothetical protein
VLRSSCADWEPVHELVQAGVAGGGLEDNENCFGWRGFRPEDLVPLLDNVDGVLWIRSSMDGLGQGPDR